VNCYTSDSEKIKHRSFRGKWVSKGRQQGEKVFYGWVVIGGLFLIGSITPMGRYILTVLFPFIMKDPGWSRQTIGLAFTIHFWAYALFSLIAGRLIDSIGGRITIFVGGAFTMLGLILLSRVQEIWQFFLVFGILMALAVSLSHFLPITVLVRKWFIKKAGLATGLVTVGIVAGFGVLAPLISHLSAALGWRAACFMCAIGFGAIIMLIAGLVIRSTPESMGLHPDGEDSSVDEHLAPGLSGKPEPSETPLKGTVHETLRTGNFRYFFIAYAVTGIPLQGVLAHVIIWGVDLGIAQAGSGIIMATVTLPSIPVRILAGWLGDRFGKKRVLIFFNLYTVVIWFMGWFFIRESSTFLVFCILLGFAYSAPFSLYTPFLGDIFGRKTVGTLMGVLTLGHGIIGGIGPYLWGWIADTTGSYSFNCLISVVCYVIVVASLTLLRTPASEKDR